MPIPSPADIAFLQSLADPLPHWGGMGARKLHFDSRDYPALWHPGIAAQLAAGPPPSVSLLPFLQLPRLDQGAEGSCVCASTEGACQIAHSQTDHSWPAYNIHELYSEAGGSGNSGSDVRTVLSICINRGAPESSGLRDPIIKSYVFLDATPGVFRTQAMAAMAAGHPVLIACLLPIPFGWITGTVLSTGYHQWLGAGYFTDAAGKLQCLVMNSWGPGWPGDAPAGTPPGVGTISFDALEQQSMQNGYVYGVVPTMTPVTPPVPTPTPTPVPIPTPIPTPLPTPTPTPTPTPAGIIVQVNSPPIYHRGLVTVRLSQTNGQFVPPGTTVGVHVTAPDGRTGQGSVTL